MATKTHPTAAPDWERISSEFPRHHSVYWNRKLPDGRHLTVGRIYNEDHTFTPGGPWEWTVWPKQEKGTPHDAKLAEGITKTVYQGRVEAEKAAGLRNAS